jgi:hypothetical protein
MRTNQKTNGMITMPHGVWQDIMLVLTQEYLDEPSVLLIRDKMRRVLGFTQRFHKEWVETGKRENGQAYGFYQEYTVLDFYNESARSWFLIKFADQLNNGHDRV